MSLAKKSTSMNPTLLNAIKNNSPILKQVYFIITRRCNLFCSHCIRSSGPDLSDGLTLEQFTKTAETIQPFANSAEILISGGEPTLHPEFYSIVNAACNIFNHVTINTNGLRKNLLLEVTSAKKNLGVQISIDGNEIYHNNIRGPNTFNRSVDAIKALAQSDIAVTVATTLNSFNLYSMDNLDVQLEDLPFHKWTIQREVIYGRAKQENAISTEDWNNFVSRVTQNFRNRNRIIINSMFNFVNLNNKLNSSKKGNDYILNCGTGTSKIYINPDLTVFPCGCMEEIILGDLFVEPIEAILEKMQLLPVEPSSYSPCKACPFYQVCKGGCPGSSLHMFGSFGVGDLRCQAVKDLVPM